MNSKAQRRYTIDKLAAVRKNGALHVTHFEMIEVEPFMQAYANAPVAVVFAECGKPLVIKRGMN